MFGLEHLVSTQPARITAPTHEQELIRVKELVRNLRENPVSLFQWECEEIADFLVGAYGIDE